MEPIPSRNGKRKKLLFLSGIYRRKTWEKAYLLLVDDINGGFLACDLGVLGWAGIEAHFFPSPIKGKS